MAKKLNVLITGARGFIGRNLVEFLGREKESYSLFSPYHKELDLTDEGKVADYVKRNGIDIIIHCANVGGSRKTGYDAGKTDVISTNLKMFFNLVNSMERVQRMIFLGSGAEYDRLHYKPRMKEDLFDKHVPMDDYGFSKYVCSKFIETSDKIVNLRIFGMFGKYEDHEFKFITNSIVKNLFHLPIVINQNVNFDYIYINDGLGIIKKFVDNKPKHKFYNLTTGKTVDLVTIADKINSISDFRSEVIVRNKGMNVEYSGDNSRLMKEVKWKFTPIEVALKELFVYYRSILPTIDRKTIETDEFLKYCTTGKCEE